MGNRDPRRHSPKMTLSISFMVDRRISLTQVERRNLMEKRTGDNCSIDAQKRQRGGTPSPQHSHSGPPLDRTCYKVLCVQSLFLTSLSDTMSQVDFWVVINNEIEPVSCLLDDYLAKVFSYLKVAKELSHTQCKFYRLKRPVPLGEDSTDDEDDKEDGTPDDVMQACLDKTNRVPVKPTKTKVSRLAEQFSKNRIYLVIDFPDPLLESEKAIGELQKSPYGVLFKCLQVTVKQLGMWTEEDMKRNLQGGFLRTRINVLPDVFKEIDDALAHAREYIETNDDTQNRDHQNAYHYKTQFDLVFTRTATHSPTVVNEREFAAFYHLLRCFDEDVKMIATDDVSSALKASNFTVHFIQPPFFSKIQDDSRSFEYQQEKSWQFPIFVDTTAAPKAFRKFTPRSDWMVISRKHRIPFVISEVISNRNETDRYRMLIQATALARAGHSLLKSSTGTFFIVAIYLDAKMVASRYIVMQHPSDQKGIPSKKVSIHQKDFNLKEVNEEVNFLREMYNLATQIDMMSGGLDEDRKESLVKLKHAAGDVLSLNSTKHPTKLSAHQPLDPVAEGTAGADGLETEDDLGVFDAEDIQTVLRQMNYKIEFIPWGHPQLAVIVNKFDNKHGYLKFVERENELKVLRYLSEIKSSSNHTISGVQFWPVQGGTVVSMPVAGGWLTSLDNPNEQLWSVALQLVEGVAFMHEHNVAHMDLKPQNVIIPLEGGHLSIIDFSVSIRVQSADARYSGVVGTEDYIAPEVRKGSYKPMLADLWSCGRTLAELCACCDHSGQRAQLLKIAGLLMNHDPEMRPRMSTLLEQLTSTEQGKDPVMRPESAIAPQTSASSSLCAA
ncbi:hypothetical protein V8E55_009138 [Tylopilus felleus]